MPIISKYLHVKWSSAFIRCIRRVDFYRGNTICTTFYYLRNLCPLTCDNNDNWGYYRYPNLPKNSLCDLNPQCHLCLEIARIPPRNNSNGHDASPFFICFHFQGSSRSPNSRICFLRFTSAASGMQRVVLRAISWDTWQKPDKDPLSWVAFKTPWNNIFVSPNYYYYNGLKIPQNLLDRTKKHEKLWSGKIQC